jgi:hypothetical protein
MDLVSGRRGLNACPHGTVLRRLAFARRRSEGGLQEFGKACAGLCRLRGEALIGQARPSAPGVEDALNLGVAIYRGTGRKDARAHKRHPVLDVKTRRSEATQLLSWIVAQHTKVVFS